MWSCSYIIDSSVANTEFIQDRTFFVDLNKAVCHPLFLTSVVNYPLTVSVTTKCLEFPHLQKLESFKYRPFIKKKKYTLLDFQDDSILWLLGKDIFILTEYSFQ